MLPAERDRQGDIEARHIYIKTNQMSKDIIIFDTTLRDGEQVPGAKLNTLEKIEIAKQLEMMGVDIIEAGFPISSPEDFKSVSLVAETIKNSTVCALARAVNKDIETAYESIKKASSPRIHTFISTSDIHLKYQIKKSREEVIQMAKAAVEQAKSYVSDVEFSAMDASRSDIDYLCEVIEVAIEAGATTINIPDTVGYAVPEEWGDFIAQIVKRIPRFNDDIVLSVHTHNDLGLATTNSMVAVHAGARQVECTINGIGERAGNCAMEEVAMIIKTRYKDKYNINIDTKQISSASRTVSQIMGIPVQPNKAIVGANAFAHSSGIHQDGILKGRNNFEIMDPEDVGVEESGIILTSRSGRSALKHRLENIGYKTTEEQLEEIYEKFLEMGDQKKEVYDEDLHLLMSTSENVSIEDHTYYLEHIQVLCGNKNTPMAQVRILNRKTEDTIEALASGTGPVDACFKAIDDALEMDEIQLREYLVQAVTEGIDANGRVSVEINKENRNYYGYGADTDVIVASAMAYVDAINKIKK